MCYLPVPSYTILDRLLRAGLDLFVCLSYPIDGYVVKNLRSQKRHWWSRKSLHCDQAGVSTGTDNPSVFTTVLNIDQRSKKVGGSGMISFDSDSTTIVCDNSANVSICNMKSMYVGEMRQTHNTSVATIGGKGHAASGIGTDKRHWKDNAGIGHDFFCLYFPQSPINILGVTSFVRQQKRNDGTGITTLQTQSRSFWDKNKFRCTACWRTLLMELIGGDDPNLRLPRGWRSKYTLLLVFYY